MSNPIPKPSTAEIITAYSLSPEEAEVICCMLRGKEKLQNFWRARVAIDALIRCEEKQYSREL